MKLASIGECMIEFSQADDGLFRRGFGGDTLNTALYLARLGIDTSYVTALGDDALSEAMLAAWRANFDAIVAGDEVPRKKPAPDVYVEALARLGLSANECLAIEDSANGLISASRAGIAVVITRSVYFHDDDFAEALLVLDDLSEFA